MAKYVLPLFSASLSCPDQVSLSSSKFLVTINAEYTFGESVSGIATLSFNRYDDPVTYMKNVSLSASTNTFEIDIKKDLKFTLNQERTFTVTLVFFDPLSNTKATDQKTISFVPYTFIVKTVGENNFKNGQPYAYKVAVQKLDGSPASKGTKVTVDVQTQLSASGTNNKISLIVGSDGFANGKLQTNASISYFNIQATCVSCSNDYRGYLYVSNLAPITTESLVLYLLSPR